MVKSKEEKKGLFGDDVITFLVQPLPVLTKHVDTIEDEKVV